MSSCIIRIGIYNSIFVWKGEEVLSNLMIYYLYGSILFLSGLLHHLFIFSRTNTLVARIITKNVLEFIASRYNISLTKEEMKRILKKVVEKTRRYALEQLLLEPYLVDTILKVLEEEGILQK